MESPKWNPGQNEKERQSGAGRKNWRQQDRWIDISPGGILENVSTIDSVNTIIVISSPSLII